MNYVTEPARKIPVVADADVLFCGGGVAGVSGAVCAARNRANVLLLEKLGFLGGLATAGLVITTPPLDNGINLEICEILKERRVYARCQHSGEATESDELHAFDPEVVKYEFLRMLQGAGVDILLHSYIAGAIMDGNVIKGVIVENKAGRQAVTGRIIVDATGDADVAAFAGAPFRSSMKPVTMMFTMVGVDTARILAHIGTWSALKGVVKKAIDEGELAFDLEVHPEFGAPGLHAEKTIYDDEIIVWSGMLHGINAVDPRDLTRAEIITRDHVVRLASFLKTRVPGFERSRIEYTATHVGMRASRQIVGEASPSRDEITKEVFEDTVVKPYRRRTFRLPYGSILPQNVENLLIAGRCISANEDIMGQLRLIPVCSATGQTAGTAAALALREGITPRSLDVSFLQKTLIEQGMDLGLR